MKNCTINEITSTAHGAEIVKNTENSACIANKLCAELSGLEIIDDNIQDVKNNQTRFIVVNKKLRNKKENKKMSLMFSTANNPGALYKILGLFNIFDINLTKIESRPAQTELGAYWFWVDIEGNMEEEKTKTLLSIMENKCSYFRILGEY